MNRFEILKGVPPRKSIIPDYYYGIDVGSSGNETVIAVCHKGGYNQSLNSYIVIFDHIESRTPSNIYDIFNWYTSINDKYPIVAGRITGANGDVSGCLNQMDPNRNHIEIDRTSPVILKNKYKWALESGLIILPQFFNEVLECGVPNNVLIATLFAFQAV
jgi:hypothetical protein